MNCKYCNKEITNNGSLVVHEKYYCKLNESRLDKKSNFVSYLDKLRRGEVKKKHVNQYDKAKSNGTVYCMEDDVRRKISEKAKKQVWDNEKRKRHSISMKNAVLNHPLSYSANNVCGRTKKIDYNGMKVTGTWELEVAKFLDRKNIKWTNIIAPFQYEWENKTRNYFPDFYLFDYDLFIEVKGNQTKRDEAKWSVVENLMIIKKNGIYELKSGIDLELTPNNSYFKRK
jgi:hypothetical protein